MRMKSNWILEPGKYLTGDEADRLLNIARQRAEESSQSSKVAVRDYFIVHLAIATGLRVMEIADLKCGDLRIQEKGLCSLIVQKGKGGKKRIVLFSGELESHCRQYLHWKNLQNEPMDFNKALIMSSNTGGHMTTRGIQKVFKRAAQRAGLYSNYSIHCLRHTYACFLLKASEWNLRLVQKQLGHSRLETTQVYADVMNPDIEKALDNFCF